jgi:phosphodiesterase/alkaline phosphatase D-like protein
VAVHDQFFFHVAHGHYHFPLASFGLYGVNPDGSVGSPVAISPKNGFCIGDSVRVDPTLPHSPSSIIYNGSTCTNPLAVRGIDPGWGDLYDRRDPGQSIDITGLPDGDYWFRAVADPDNNFVESDKSNNTTDIKVHIAGDTVTPISPLVSQGSFVYDGQGYDIGKGPADETITTTQANDLLVAFVSAEGGALPQTATVAGGGLTWTLASRANTQAGTSEVWTAMAPAPLANALITSNTSSTGYDQQMTVLAVHGAGGVGAVAASSGASGAANVGLTTTTPGSWVMGVGNDPDHYIPHTPASGQQIVQQWVNEAGSDGSWVQAPASPTPASGTPVSIADTGPVGDRWNMTAIELLPAASNDHTPPVISGLSAGTIGPDRATVGWSTDEVSTSQVEYGTTSALGQSTTKSNALVTGHSQQITGLSPSTNYFYRARSTDASGNEAVSAIQQFTTTPPRTTPAIISNVHVSDLEPDQATFAWTTDEPTNSRVEYGTTASYGGTSPPDSTLTTAHFVVVTGLTPSTTYHYRVGGTDPYGNDGVSGDFTLMTPALPPPITVDTTVSQDGKNSVTTGAFSTSAPGELLLAFVALDGPSSVGQIANVSGAGLTWSLVSRADTNPGDAEVWQATAPATLSNATVTATVGTGNYDESLTVVAFQGAAGVGNVVGSNGTAAPSVSLSMTGSGSVVYAVGNDWDRAVSHTPLSGQSMVHQFVDTGSGDTFWTQALNGPAGPVESLVTMGDSAPTSDRWNMVAVELVRPISVAPVAPTISGVGASNLTSSSATISWATDQPSSSQIDYGPTSTYGSSTTLDSTAVLSHSQTITGLSPSTTYHYRVRSANGVGTTNSGDFTFTTTSNLTAQTITFGALSSKTLAQSPVTVTATASSGLAVTFSTTTPSVCTSGGTNGATVTLTAVGTCTVKADQAGNATFAAAPSVLQSFTVTSGSSGALAVDTTVFKDGKGAQTTAAFSTAGPGELLLALVASDGPTAGGQRSTVTGAGLTWTLVKRTNTQAGTAEIWSATAGSALSGVTVKSTLNSANFDQSLTVIAFTGAGGTGATGTANATSGAPTVSLTTTQAGAFVFGVGNDWDRAVGRTVAAGQSLVHQFVDSTAGDTFWSQSAGGPFASAGTAVSVSDTAPTNDRFNYSAVEVVPSNATPVAPTIFGVSASGITSSSATVAWSTDVASSSQIEYGTTTSYGTTTTLDNTAVTAHQQVLGGLAPSTTYHYRVISGNAVGTTTSGDGSFTTLATQSPQTITFPALSDRTLAQSPFTVAATASSGLPVTFTATTAACATSGPTGSTVTLLTPGTCTIKADQAGNASFSPAPSVTRSFTVLPNATGSLAVDKTVFVDGTGNRTTAAFSTSGPNEVLVAFVAADGATAGGQQATVSGAGLTWTMVKRSNTQAGDAEIWTATASSTLTNVTVSSSPTTGNKDQSLTVVAFTGSAGVGASATANGATGAPSVSLTTTGPGSLVFGIGNDWDTATARTPASGQSLVHQFVDTRVGDTFWCQSAGAAVASAGTVVSVADTAPTADRWNYAAVEILSS